MLLFVWYHRLSTKGIPLAQVVLLCNKLDALLATSAWLLLFIVFCWRMWYSLYLLQVANRLSLMNPMYIKNLHVLSLGYCLPEILFEIMFICTRNHFSLCAVYVWNKCKVTSHMHPPENIGICLMFIPGLSLKFIAWMYLHDSGLDMKTFCCVTVVNWILCMIFSL